MEWLWSCHLSWTKAKKSNICTNKVKKITPKRDKKQMKRIILIFLHCHLQILFDGPTGNGSQSACMASQLFWQMDMPTKCNGTKSASVFRNLWVHEACLVYGSQCQKAFFFSYMQNTCKVSFKLHTCFDFIQISDVVSLLKYNSASEPLSFSAADKLLNSRQLRFKILTSWHCFMIVSWVWRVSLTFQRQHIHVHIVTNKPRSVTKL